MNKSISLFCHGFEEAERIDNPVDQIATKFVKKNANVVASQLREIIEAFYLTTDLILETKYKLISSLASRIKSDAFGAICGGTSAFPQITSEMKFFYEYMEEWRGLWVPEVGFDEWADLAERGLKLLLSMLREPRRQKSFLRDDEFEAFRTDFSSRYRLLAEKYGLFDRELYQ